MLLILKSVYDMRQGNTSNQATCIQPLTFHPPPMEYEYELVVSSLAWKGSAERS